MYKSYSVKNKFCEHPIYIYKWVKRRPLCENAEGIAGHSLYMKVDFHVRQLAYAAHLLQYLRFMFQAIPDEKNALHQCFRAQSDLQPCN